MSLVTMVTSCVTLLDSLSLVGGQCPLSHCDNT